MNTKSYILVFVVSILISFFLYGNSLSHEFIWDDFIFAGRVELRNPGYLKKLWLEPLDVSRSTPISYRPTLIFTAVLNFLITGESAVGFHLFSILLNGLVTFLVFVLVYKLFFSKTLTIFSSLLFAFFPIHTEAVAQIKSRDSLLATFFMLITWIFFLNATEKKEKVNYSLIFFSSVFFLLTLFSKEFKLIGPLIMLIVFFLQKNPQWLTIIKIGLLYLPAVIIYMIMRYLALGSFEVSKIDYMRNPLFYSDWLTRIGTSFKAVSIYLIKILAPYNLSATYAYNHFPLVKNPLHSWESLLFIGLFAGLIYLIFNKKTRTLPLTIGLVFFFIAIICVSNLIILLTDLFTERWAYFPSIGIAIAAGYLINLLYKRWRSISLIIFIIMLTIYTIIIWKRNIIWTSNARFYKQVVIDAPDSVYARWMLAEHYAQKGDFSSAKPQIEQGLQILRISKLVELASISAYNDGDFTKAKQLALEALKYLNKEPSRVHLIYALILTHEHKYQDSLNLTNWILSNGKNYQAIVVEGGTHRNPFTKSNPVIKFILALDYFKMGNIEMAKEYFDWDSRYSNEEKIKILKSY
ncbi:MAG: hypothetical protein WC741_03315 [Patescibacteria group bacterium]|jgi:tetratricopeptide (TPR) repeat protein